MFHRRSTPLVLVILLVPAAGSMAQDPGALTLEQAISLARERSPLILAARAGIEEALGRRIGASLRLRGNPILEGAAGRRELDGERSTDLELGVFQGLEAAGSRGSRIAGAEAGVERERAAAEEVERTLVRDVAATFLRALHAEERLALEREALGVAEEVARVAERRLQAGDVAVLDVHVARAALARARAEMHSAAAGESALLGDLRTLLAAPAGERIHPAGELAPGGPFDLERLLDRAGDRPDLRALSAGIDQAEADTRLARTSRRPEIEVGLRYEREEEADVFLGGLALSLPVLDRGRAVITESEARLSRLRIEREGSLLAARTQVRAAFDAHLERVQAAEALREILPSLAESEELAARSYEAGQMSLLDLLIVRREILETRRSHADRLLEAALAAIELESNAGVLS